MFVWISSWMRLLIRSLYSHQIMHPQHVFESPKWISPITSRRSPLPTLILSYFVCASRTRGHVYGFGIWGYIYWLATTTTTLRCGDVPQTRTHANDQTMESKIKINNNNQISYESNDSNFRSTYWVSSTLLEPEVYRSPVRCLRANCSS